MSKYDIYTDIGEDARPVGGVWVIPQLIIIALLSVILMVIGVLGSIIAFGPMHGVDLMSIAEGGDIPSDLLLISTAIGSFFMFIGFIVFPLIKVKMEKRSLASAGFSDFLYGKKFWKGAILGLLLAAASLALSTVIVGSSAVAVDGEFVLERLMTQEFLIGTILLIGFVLVQAPSEEVLMRGWVLSGLSARHGFIFAAIFSSLVFGLLHIDRAFENPMVGAYYVLITSILGFFFAAVAKRTGSIAMSAGLHTGYNFLFFLSVGGSEIGRGKTENILEAFIGTLNVDPIIEVVEKPSFWLYTVILVTVLLIISFWCIRGKPST